jgi:predicted KAP-like P-loop ATPase
MIEIDKPIIEEADDKFSRVDYVNSIANHIKNNKTKDCTIIGINGAWGTGKTSILNLLKKELQKQFFYTEEFNPWRYKTESQMLIKLFEKIHFGSKSDKNLKDSVKELGKRLLEYGEFVAVPEIKIGPFGVDFSNVVKGITKGIGKKLSKRKHTLEDVKERINEILNDLALPLIIFVDDIDRLDNTEIRQLFKLLKLTADFNNLVYIVAFDDEVVSNVLNEDYLGKGDLKGGKEFLEKIINIPLPIPHLSNQKRHEFFIKRLVEFSSDLNLSLAINYEFNRSLRDCSIMLLKTPRDVKRVINSISFLRACLKNEVSFNDLIILEILRLYAPDVFSQIINLQDFLFDFSLKESFEIPGDKIKITETRGDFFSKIDEVRYKKAEIISIVSYLFPFNTLFSSRPRPISEQFKKELSLQNRVALQNNFERYLKIGLLENELSSVLLDSILENINTKNLDESLIMVNEWNDKNFNQIFEYLNINEESFNVEGKYKLYQIYCVSEYFNQRNEMNFMTGVSPVHHVIKKFSSLSQLDTFLTEIIERITKNDKKVYFISLFRNAIKEDSQSQKYLDFINSIASSELKKILESDISDLFANPEEYKIYHILDLVIQLELYELFQEKLLSYIKLTGDILKVARSFIQKSYYFGDSTPHYSDELTDDYFNRLEKVLNREVLVEEFNKLKYEYPLNYEITDDIKKVNGIIIHKYFDYVGRTKVND